MDQKQRKSIRIITDKNIVPRKRSLLRYSLDGISEVSTIAVPPVRDAKFPARLWQHSRDPK